MSSKGVYQCVCPYICKSTLLWIGMGNRGFELGLSGSWMGWLGENQATYLVCGDNAQFSLILALVLLWCDK